MVGAPFFAVTTVPPGPASLIDQVRPISIGNYTAIKSYDLPYGLKTNFSARTFDLNAKGERIDLVQKKTLIIGFQICNYWWLSERLWKKFGYF